MLDDFRNCVGLRDVIVSLNSGFSTFMPYVLAGEHCVA